MACCGSQRTQFQATTPSLPQSSPVVNSPAVMAPARQLVVCFEYVGHSRMTVIGGATGRRYRFDRPGARVIVDPRDRPSLAAILHLREVRNST